MTVGVVRETAVVGAGAWGTALADLLARNGHPVVLWAHEPDVAASINAEHENHRFLSGARLAPAVRATTDLADALDGASLVCLATPSHVLRSIVRRGVAHLARGATICVASKGIEVGSLELMSDVVAEEAPGHPIVALSGPSFAAEVVAQQPTAIVAASDDEAASAMVQEAFSNTHFRVYTHDDIIGVELGGSLKNVMAVAAGIVEGVGLGFNSRAALITRGLAEMTRLGNALGAKPATFAGLAGMGDLVLTCTGSLSRNRAVGVAVGRGATLAEALAGKETIAEGVTTTRSAHALAAREGVEMPIVATVHRILFDGHPARLAVNELMSRELRAEQDA
ncbi:MAG TPA: NAD(P)H-dependent glycerol-3-phosphate dehydrogenase [Gemmatimonadaceae bacterium]|nr:NAD(P)H-dependent glycerol-3-phosphate dehydrogenase [Gemmatimonadaceae bacterium]